MGDDFQAKPRVRCYRFDVSKTNSFFPVTTLGLLRLAVQSQDERQRNDAAHSLATFLQRRKTNFLETERCPNEL
ncbi:hypothetical protein RESH_02620 [Rhodopirellula europaea SH398]|uniref:Uncharacterized protein n=1 Tax=Rhodopirellula europaea SH398 TaxID=1263868 RepID=M5SGA8_9BACT|nr:hypothetical protein RESH_02620 [Rhodopirellula europaea SH398]